MARRFVRFAASLAAALLLCVLVTALPAAAVTPVSRAAPAGGTVTVAILGFGVTVHGAGTTWRLGVSVGGSPSGDVVTATIVHGSRSGAEEHQYSVSRLPASSVRKVGPTEWVIHPPAARVSPLFPAFDLTFIGTRHSAVACSAGSETDYKGTLKGALKLATGFHGMGTVGGMSLSFTGPATAAVDSGCKAEVPCASSLTWSALPTGSSNPVLAGGITEKGVDAISITKMNKLARPANAARNDIVAAVSEPPATYSGGTLSATTTPGTPLTGSVQVSTQFTEPTQETTCYLNGVAHSETVSLSIGSFSSSLSGRTLLTGTLAPGAAGSGSVTQVSFS